MDIYENVVIGSFLYGLGAAVGARVGEDGSPLLAANLLQQTPLDKTTGDVLVRGARTMRLLEFKRTTNDDNKEASKLKLLTAALAGKATADLAPISPKIHWFIETKNSAEKFNINIRPYLSMENSRPSP